MLPPKPPLDIGAGAGAEYDGSAGEELDGATGCTPLDMLDK